MSSWYYNDGPDIDIAVSSRIRLARNISGFPFPSRMTDDRRTELLKTVKSAVQNSDNPLSSHLKFIEMKDIPEDERGAMVERHIISPEFASIDKPRAVIISEDESISVMVGEEDHIRIQVLYAGLQLEKAYETAAKIDAFLCDSLDIAFNEELGFLTECPTNLGTGLRASVMLHLPVLEAEGKLGSFSESINKLGYTMRGMYGEGSKSQISLYQLSNQITLGISEKSAIDNLKIIASQLIEKERAAREGLNRVKIDDIAMRALGTLKYARILSSNEMMKLVSEIKLGLGLGIINEEINPIRILVEGQPYMLMRRFGRMSPDERDIYRANMVRGIVSGKEDNDEI